MYDETGAKPNNLDKTSPNFVPDDLVVKLQQNLTKIQCYSKTATGYFGNITEASVKLFQEYARERKRMRSNNTFDEAFSTLQKAPDGIYDDETDKELKVWLDKGYIAPHPPLRHGEYDDKGANSGKGARGADEHHKGTPVEEAQKDLAAIGAYDGQIDGWVFDKMKAGIDRFLDAAKEGKFVVNGKVVDVGETLKVLRKGILSPQAHAFLKKRVAEGAKVPKQPNFPLPANYKNADYHSGSKSFGSLRNNGKRIHAGCDLFAPIGTKVFAVDDGVVLRYYDFYGQTYALEVKHGNIIVRYGEIQPPKDHTYGSNGPSPDECKGLASGIETGIPVKRGQHIGYVGRLRLLNTKTGKIENFKDTMLHFELYSGTKEGNLTDRTNLDYDNVPVGNYQRRADLLNPTKYLDNCHC